MPARSAGMIRTLPAAAALLLPAIAAGCISFRTVDDGISRARLDETVGVGPLTVTPLRLIEDSRCPQGVQCIWAGRVVVAVRVEPAGPGELATGRPAPVAGGTLALVEVYPARREGITLYPDEYRFGFSYSRRP